MIIYILFILLFDVSIDNGYEILGLFVNQSCYQTVIDYLLSFFFN